jgi:hypothetical protein
MRNDLWRTDPSLQILEAELEEVSNTEAVKFYPDMMRHDWYRTLLYERIYTTGILEFNSEGSRSMFLTETDVATSFNNMIRNRDRMIVGDGIQLDLDLEEGK